MPAVVIHRYGGPEVVGHGSVPVTTFVGDGRGAQAARVVLGARDVASIPAGASTLPMSALTALVALERLALPEGARLGVDEVRV